MTREEFEAMIQEIGTTEDEAQRRTLLANLQNETGSIFEENETLQNSNNELTESVKNLQSENYKLFTQIGSKTPAESKKDFSGEEEPKPKKKFEDLFDENGGLK